MASVLAWNRIAAALVELTETLFKVAVLRYVDDMFGCSKEGLVWDAGRCVTFVADLLGFPCDQPLLGRSPFLSA